LKGSDPALTEELIKMGVDVNWKYESFYHDGYIAKYPEKIAAIKMNNSHHISKAIADNTPLVAVFEDLKIKNMTRRAKAKQDPETGRWLRNNAKAKSGLKKALLGANLGQIRDLTKYKLRDRGKLF